MPLKLLLVKKVLNRWPFFWGGFRQKPFLRKIMGNTMTLIADGNAEGKLKPHIS